MNEAPKGKIGRLPMAIQEQVNRRREQGERARTLVAWLNARPEVSLAVCAAAPDSNRAAKLLLPRRGLSPRYEAG
jgi:hypothetical protein